MKKICKVTVNDEPFLANRGDLLLDWALMNGVDLPHDCRAGICGACKVRLVDGTVFGGQTRGDDMIHACQARIVSDLEIAIEAAPEPTTLPARVAQTVQLAPDVVGVDVELPKSLEILPGQYCKLQFQGFPARPYSPTYPLEGRPHDRVLHFHVRKVSDGLVSSALGRDIRAGHRVKLTGPFAAPSSGPAIPAASCSSPAAPVSLRCGRLRSRRSWSSRSANWCSWWRRGASVRSTCTPRSAGWRCFPT